MERKGHAREPGELRDLFLSTARRRTNDYKEDGFFEVVVGGYSAGYYSYVWAEVFDADAFEAFKENGILDRATGMKFRETILAKGGTEDAMVLFKDFRGRGPEVEPLLKRRGLYVERQPAGTPTE